MLNRRLAMPIEVEVSSKKVRVNNIFKNEKCLYVIFINNEFPKADLEFSFDRRRWHLKDGEKYKLPFHVIEHLNGLVIPESKYETDANTGQLAHISTVMRHRFTCHPVDLGQLAGIKDMPEEETDSDPGKKK